MGTSTLVLLAVLAFSADDPLAEAKRDLRSSRVEPRRAAAQALTRVDTEEAWDLLLRALDDSDSRVADIAQWHLATVGDARWARKALFGRDGLDARSEGVRWRVAELLGRTEHEWTAKELARELGSRDPECVRLLCWSIERLAERSRIVDDARSLREALGRVWRKSRSGGAQAAALCALARLEDPDWLSYVAASLTARERELRCAAVPRIGELGASQAAAHWSRALADPDSGVRACAVRALVHQARASEVLELVQLLERESSPRVLQDVVAALRVLSGLKHRSDPRPWRLWAESLDEHWRPDRSGHADRGARQEGAADDSRVRFADLPILSDRVCFLIDFSGSMWMPAADGSIPKERVDVLLRQTLESLDAGVLFNIVPFANEPIPWREELVPATRRNVRAALADFERCRARGRGNFFDAFRCALADPQVDTIVTLTDGVPTDGFHSRLELVEARVLELQRFRPVALDSILVDCSPGVRWRWERMSELTGGRSVELRLP